MRSLLAFLLLVTLSAEAQQIGQNAAPGNTDVTTLSVRSQIVIETVVVRDKKGNTIDGLTAKDFTITEDGVPQTIRFCEPQSMPSALSDVPLTPSGPEDIKIYNRLARTQITPESPGDVRYKDHRLMALYFDMSAMRPADQLRALAAAEKFIRTQMATSDLISIMRYSGGAVDVLQDFTADRNRLLSILETLVVGEG
jgi:VWFA-related protein